MTIREQIKERFPFVTLQLILSCLITTIPQFFLSPVYGEFTGIFPDIRSIYLVTLSVFAHSPEHLFTHVLFNCLTILLFGGLVEIILGSSRFSIITLITLISSTVVSYFHSTANSSTHGVSGVCFGYIVFFIFFIIVLYEKRKSSVFKNPVIVILVLYALFLVFIIPILEVVVQKRRLFDNFGQTIHLISYSSVIPLLLVWRRDFEENSMLLITKELTKGKLKQKKFSIILLISVLVLNGFSTSYIISKINRLQQETFQYSVEQESETDLLIKSSVDMLIGSEFQTTKSITHNTIEPPTIEFNWIDNKTIRLKLSRPLEDGESVKLVYKVKCDIFDGIYIERLIEINM